jgi:hypothetical protein
MLRTIVEDAIRTEPDMELLDGGDGHDLWRTIESQHADVAILGEGGLDGRAANERLLLDHSLLKLLILGRDGRDAHILELRRTPVIEVSPGGLVDAIRVAVRS